MAILAAGIGVFVYVSSKNNPVQVPAGKLELKKLTEEKVISPASNLSGDALWYANKEGKIFRMSMSSYEFFEFPFPALLGKDIQKIDWQPEGQDFIAWTLTENLQKKKIPTVLYYSNQKKAVLSLPENIKDIQWLANGERVAMVWQSGDGTKKLVVSGPDATGYRIVSDLPYSNPQIFASPSTLAVLVVNQGFKDRALLINLDSGEARQVGDVGYKWGARWAPSGQRILLQSSTLILLDVGTGDIKDLGIKTALSKTAFGQQGKILYAAVEKEKDADKFIKIDLDSGETNDYYVPENPIRSESLFNLDGRLFFTEAKSGLLYVIE